MDVDSAGFGIPARNYDHSRLDVGIAGRENAINEPTLGWSGYEREYYVARVGPLNAASFNSTPIQHPSAVPS